MFIFLRFESSLNLAEFTLSIGTPSHYAHSSLFLDRGVLQTMIICEYWMNFTDNFYIIFNFICKYWMNFTDNFYIIFNFICKYWMNFTDNFYIIFNTLKLHSENKILVSFQIERQLKSSSQHLYKITKIQHRAFLSKWFCKCVNVRYGVQPSRTLAFLNIMAFLKPLGSICL